MTTNEPIEYPKVRIRYEGPRGSHTVVGLATRTKYGRHEHGDIFWVHRADVEANEEYFTILGDQDGSSIADSLPKTPDAIRLPGPPPLSEGITIEPLLTPEEAYQVAAANAEQRFIEEDAAASAQAVEEELAGAPESGEGSIEGTPEIGERPANLITLDQVGISERITSILAGVGLFSVADVVGVILEYGADGLREHEGIGQGSVREIVEKLTEAGYLAEAGE